MMENWEPDDKDPMWAEPRQEIRETVRGATTMAVQAIAHLQTLPADKAWDATQAFLIGVLVEWADTFDDPHDIRPHVMHFTDIATRFIDDVRASKTATKN